MVGYIAVVAMMQGLQVEEVGRGGVDVVEPFRWHQRPAMLSVRDRVVFSQISKQSAMQAWCNILPDRSSLLLVTMTVVFFHIKSAEMISAGKCYLHTM